MNRHPLLHDRLVCLAAPTQAWSGPDGQIRSESGIDGVYHADVRVLSAAALRAAGAEPDTIATAQVGPGAVHVSTLVHTLGDGGADPTARLDRHRTVTAGTFAETLVLSSAAAKARTTLALRVAVDLAPMDDVRSGRPDLTPIAVGITETGELHWSGGGVDVVLIAPGAQVTIEDPEHPVLTWDVEAGPGRPAEVSYRLSASDRDAPVVPSPTAPLSVPEVSGGDDRLRALLQQSVNDLTGLVMATAETPDQPFVAAGAPWFLTLFGRDSLWTARMLLPLGTDLAGSTLRTLAARQGVRNDIDTAEQPGKILHEVRREAMELGDGTRLPPVYYGTIDATPLWLCLLHDAWRWGMPAEEVEPLLPHAERALAWLVESGDADGDGFLEYIDLSGRGLANQGWKDSGDSIQWRDGSLAEGTIALCEVQAYAHEAAIGGAALLEAFDRGGAAEWRDWAAGMRARFRDRFWVEDSDGRYPAVALDGEKRPVDTLTSNIGHLLGTGLLDSAEERLVADRLTSPRLSSGFGVHTLAHGSAGFWPLSYHGGTVWPHDTAIAVSGLARAGLGQHAGRLAQQLLRAAPGFDYRLPELFSGDRLDDVPRPAPYPGACRPQAWSAASAVALLTAVLGIAPDVPGGTVAVRPSAPGPLTVRGLRLGRNSLDVAVAADGSVTIETEASVAVGP